MVNYYDEKHVSSSLRWMGGKALLAPKLLTLIPEHHCWVDVFGGGGHMTVSKKRSRVEVFNDKDQELINFLLMLRARRSELIEALASLPTSRFLFEKWQREELPKDEFDRAVRFFYCLRQCIIPANGIKSGWRSGKIKNTANDYQNAVDKLEAFEERFRRVMIECLDYKEIIQRYDSPGSFLYVDPPYVNREHYYKFSFDEHELLANMLHQLQGNCMVSYYGDPLILELYSGWHCTTFKSKVGKVAKAEMGQTRREEIEYVFTNYKPAGSSQLSFF